MDNLVFERLVFQDPSLLAPSPASSPPLLPASPLHAQYASSSLNPARIHGSSSSPRATPSALVLAPLFVATSAAARLTSARITRGARARRPPSTSNSNASSFDRRKLLSTLARAGTYASADLDRLARGPRAARAPGDDLAPGGVVAPHRAPGIQGRARRRVRVTRKDTSNLSRVCSSANAAAFLVIRTLGGVFRRAEPVPGAPDLDGVVARTSRRRRSADIASRVAAAATSACVRPVGVGDASPSRDGGPRRNASYPPTSPTREGLAVRGRVDAEDAPPPPIRLEPRPEPAVAGRARVRFACLRFPASATSRVRPPPPPNPTPTGARPSSTDRRAANLRRGCTNGAGGGVDVPNATRARFASVSESAAFDRALSASRASTDAAFVLLASCRSRRATFRGSASTASGGNRIAVNRPPSSAATVNACRPGPTPPPWSSGYTYGTRHSSPNNAGATSSPRGTSRVLRCAARRGAPPPVPDAEKPATRAKTRRLTSKTPRSPSPPRRSALSSASGSVGTITVSNTRATLSDEKTPRPASRRRRRRRRARDDEVPSRRQLAKIRVRHFRHREQFGRARKPPFAPLRLRRRPYRVTSLSKREERDVRAPRRRRARLPRDEARRPRRTPRPS